ncbi:MAG TPA: OB-fold nucleic acid binding domain-containing protein, partial [Spirochaetota bacterium]|nr:OB-fold nucleic acid binding domain-containing protein [Spirochaetota bacterium]
MSRTLIKHALQQSLTDTKITVKGWIRTRRDSKGGFSFLEVNDGSCLANLQIIADKKLPNYSSDVIRLYPGAAVA